LFIINRFFHAALCFPSWNIAGPIRDAYHVSVAITSFYKMQTILATLIFGIVAFDWDILIGATVFYNVKRESNVF
jgi:hypothetical protein